MYRKRGRRDIDRRLLIQIPGLIAGGFVEHLPGGRDTDAKDGPYDLPTRTIPVDGTDLHYFEFGQGHPVIFVHGAFADYRAWLNQIEPFSQRCRCIAYSRRHHYPNPWHDDGSTACTALHGEDLAQLITQLKAGPATLIGQSLGATIALHTAIGHPDLVHSLVLSEPFILPWLQATDVGRAAWGEFDTSAWTPAAAELRAGNRENCIRLVTDGIMGTGAYDNFPPDIKPIVLDNSAELRLEFDNVGYYSDVSPHSVSALPHPVLLVEGDMSPRLFSVITDDFSRHKPSTERLKLPGVCHVAPFLAPEAFNEAVFAFLKRHGAAVR